MLRDSLNSGRIKVVPQLNFNSHVIPYLDSFMYVALRGVYIAQGGERYLTIGNFDNCINTVFMHITKQSQIDGVTNAYLNSVFIDDISLVADTAQPMISLSEFKLGNDTAICPGSSIQLGGQPYFFHYWWNTGDTTRFITTSQPGTYWCTVDYGCSNYTDTINITNSPALGAFTLPDTVLCGTQPYTAHPPSGYASYLWSTGGTTPTFTFTNPDTYWLHTINTCGQAFADTFTLTSAPFIIPGININTIPPTILCDGTSMTFITNNTGAGASPHYQWYKNDLAITGATSPTYTDAALHNADTLIIAMYSSANCPVTQPTISNKVGVVVSQNINPSVQITANPGPVIHAGQTVSFIATPVNGGPLPAYQWFLNGQAVPATGSIWQTSNLRDGDVIQTRLESSMPCAFPALVYSNSVTVRIGTTVAGISEAGFGVYPNPVKEQLNIDLTSISQNIRLAIYDNFGRQIKNTEMLTTQHNVVDVHTLIPGIYFYQILLNENNYRGKFLKE